MIRFVLACLALLVGCTTANGPTPTTTQPATPSTSPACWYPGHIYHPTRLRFLGCRTAIGLATTRVAEPDGDYHVRLQLDPAYRDLIAGHDVTLAYPGGNGHQHGQLVVEEPCQHPVTQPDAIDACAGYISPYPPLTTGHRYQITGNWVIDRDHYGWAELHGLASIKQLS